MKTKNPVAGSDRVPLNIKAVGTALDTQEPKSSSSESPAVRHVARRFNLSVYHARTVCELAGIGGAV
ncbi:hypothetical protein ACLE20_06985 [Rhizobium sp. YIM 134829]|uniref:hypothetical protein n=1 Tax=Rhizobium sp. YIM 134829 TaxID=3390453 RepID=UPI00397B8FF2